MKRKQLVKATAKGRRFSLEVPPVEKWILKFESFRAAKLKSGRLLVIDGYADANQIGWIAHIHKDFGAVIDSGEYYAEFYRALAHALGIERMRWKGIWLETDDYLCDIPMNGEELRAYHLRRAGQLEAAGRMEQARAFRKSVGLSETIQ